MVRSIGLLAIIGVAWAPGSTWRWGLTAGSGGAPTHERRKQSDGEQSNRSGLGYVRGCGLAAEILTVILRQQQQVVEVDGTVVVEVARVPVGRIVAVVLGDDE